MEIRDFRDLRVWREGIDLVVAIYQATQSFPQHELYGLTNQMRRAATSIPSNVAEGKTRGHLGTYLNHVSIARGSLAELQTQLEISTRLGYGSSDELQQIKGEAEILARRLTALKNSLEAKR